MLSTYAGYQFYARDPEAAAKRVAAQAIVSRETAYYRANIGKVKSVDDLLADNRLYTYALKSFGLEDAIPNRGFIRKVLTSDLTQSRSFANALNDTRYRTLAAAFGFSTSGKVVSSAVAQGAAQEDETLGLYASRTLVGTTQQADIAYYQSHIDNVHAITDLTSDSRLYRIALQAYGLDPTTTSVGTVTQLLESDRFSASSVAAQSGSPSNAVQSRASIASTTALYAARVGTDADAQNAAAVETAYYEAAMPDVHSVDAFLSDSRLVNYVAQAFDLASSAAAVRTYAQAQGATDPSKLSAAQSSDVMRATLTSDLSVAGNVADTLGGGFRQMAASLGFGPRTFQSAADTADTVARYARAAGTDAASQSTAAVETAYYGAKVATMRTPDQLVADPRLMAYVTQAFGLSFAAGATDEDRRQTVLSALSGDPTAARGGSAFVDLASAFDSARPVHAQSAAAAESTIDLYGQRATADPQAAAAETAYYRAKMPGVKSVDALLGDSRLTAYLVQAYDIAVPANATAADTTARLRAVLTSNPDDPAGAAAAGGQATQRLASAFRFTATGTVSAQPWPSPAAGAAVWSAAAARATANLYVERLGPNLGDQAQGQLDIDHAQAVIAAARTIDDVVADKDVVTYLAKAYGIAFVTDATVAAKASAIRTILASDPDDPKSIASQQGNGARALAAAFTFSQPYHGDAALTRNAREDLAGFAAAFNFDASGSVVAPRVAQSAHDTSAMLALFRQAAPAAGRSTAAVQADAAYLQASIGKVRTLDGFLSDARLVSVATTAYGVARPAGLSDAAWTSRLKAVLSSDLANPRSVANTLGGAYRDLAAGFNFAPDGTLSKGVAQAAQSGKAAILAANPYVTQAMEDQAGDANPGVQLALYFRRHAPNITSMFQILADKSLLSVVKTGLGLPDTFSKLDIDAQARAIGNKLKRSDLTDPKKLDAFVKRFAVRYDSAQAKATPPATPFDFLASGTETTSNTLLGTIYAKRTATDPGSILNIFGSN